MSTIETSPQVNDVDLAAVGSLAQAITDDSAKAATTWKAEVAWKGGFRSEASIRDFAPIPSDEPHGLGGTDTAPNPVEQVLGALGNCLAVGYAANASDAGIELRDLRIELEGDLDLHTFLGLADGNAGFSGVTVNVHLDADAPAEELAALHEKVTSTSPVGHTLARALPVDIVLA
ncbi:MAG: OsmC family protein [Actinomycetota bacterium]